MTAMKLSVSVDAAWASDDAPTTKCAAEGVEYAKGDRVTTYKFTPSPCLSTSTTTGTALADSRRAPGSLGSSNLQRSSNSSTCTHPVRPAFFYAYRNEPLPAAMLAPYQHASVAQPLLGSIPAARTASAPAMYQQQLYGQQGDMPVAQGGARRHLNASNCPGWVSAAALQQLQSSYETARHGALDALDCMDPCWGLGPGDMDGQESEHSQDSSDLTDPMQQDDDDTTASCHMSTRSAQLQQRPPLEAQASMPSKWPAAGLAPHLLLRKTMSAAQLMMGGSPREPTSGPKTFGGLQPGSMELQRLRSWLSLAGADAPSADGAAGSGCSSGNASSGTVYGVGRRAGSCLRQGSNTSSPRVDSGSSCQPFGRHHSLPSRQNSSRLITSEADAAYEADVSGSRGSNIVLGGITAEERAAKIQRYRDKRTRRNFGKRGVQYQCRKSLADTRPRVRGRFARDTDAGIVMPHQTKKAQRAAAAAAAAAARAQRAAAAAAAVAQLPSEYQPDAAAAAAAWVNGEAQQQKVQKQQTASRARAAPKAAAAPAATASASPMRGLTLQARQAASQSPSSTANTSPAATQLVNATGWDATPPLRSDQQLHAGTSNSTTHNAMPTQQLALRRAAPASLQIPTQLPRAPLCMAPLQVPPAPTEASSLQGLLYSDLLPQLPSSMTGHGACKDHGEVTEADARLAAAFLGLESPGAGAFAITPGSLPMLLNGLPSNGSDPGDVMQLDLNGFVLPCGALVGGGGGQADLLLASLGVTFDHL